MIYKVFDSLLAGKAFYLYFNDISQSLLFSSYLAGGSGSFVPDFFFVYIPLSHARCHFLGSFVASHIPVIIRVSYLS